MAHLFVLENSKRHIFLCGQGAKPYTTHLPVLCSVSAYPNKLYHSGGETFIKFLCLEHSERNGAFYEEKNPDNFFVFPDAFIY